MLKLVRVDTVLCATEPVKSGVKRYYTFDPEQTKYVYCEGLIREKEKLLLIDEISDIGPNYPRQDELPSVCYMECLG